MRRPLALLASVAFLVAAGCSKRPAPAALPTTVATPPALSGLPGSPFPEDLFPSGSPSSGSSPQSETLEDGRHFGYIRSVDIHAHTLVFDRAQFFSGEEANDAAHEDGAVPEGEPVPNDVYIRNVNPLLRTAPIADDVEILIVNWDSCCGLIHGVLAAFAAAFDGTDLDPSSANYVGSRSPYWLTVVDGRVVGIEEQYLP